MAGLVGEERGMISEPGNRRITSHGHGETIKQQVRQKREGLNQTPNTASQDRLNPVWEPSFNFYLCIQNLSILCRGREATLLQLETEPS